jgi:hypothetical protein
MDRQQFRYVQTLFESCSVDWTKLLDQNTMQCDERSGDITVLALPDLAKGDVDPRLLAKIGSELPRLRRLDLSLVYLDYSKIPGVEPKFYLANLPNQLRELSLVPGSESLRLVGDLLATESNSWCLSLDTEEKWSAVAREDEYGMRNLSVCVYDVPDAPTVTGQEYVMLVREMAQGAVVPCDVLRELLVYQENERSEEVREYLKELTAPSAIVAQQHARFRR